MKMNSAMFATVKAVASIAVVIALGVLSACSSTSDKGKLAELPAIDPQISAKLVWSARVGTVNTPLEIEVEQASNSSAVTAASSDGVVASFDAATGRVLWRVQAGKSLSSGAGVNGDLAAVVTEANELVAFNKRLPPY